MPFVSIVRTLCVFHLAKSTGIASGRTLIIILLQSSAAQSSGDIDLPLAAMDTAMQALCFFYRNPPSDSGVRPQPFKKIPKLIRRPSMSIERIKSVVRRFCVLQMKRGRRVGWRKTTQ